MTNKYRVYYYFWVNEGDPLVENKPSKLFIRTTKHRFMQPVVAYNTTPLTQVINNLKKYGYYNIRQVDDKLDKDPYD